MKSYNVGVVLGNQVGPDGRFPDAMYRCLDRVAELYRQRVIQVILVAGNYAVEYDFTGREPYPERECDVSAEYLIRECKIPPEAIWREGESKDTLQNLVELKKLLGPFRSLWRRLKRRMWSVRRILIVAPAHRAERLEWLAWLVMGTRFTVEVDGTVPAGDPQAVAHEAFVLARSRELLADMTRGDHKWLEAQFFDGPIYKFWRTFAEEAAARGLLAIQYSAVYAQVSHES